LLNTTLRCNRLIHVHVAIHLFTGYEDNSTFLVRRRRTTIFLRDASARLWPKSY